MDCAAERSIAACPRGWPAARHEGTRRIPRAWVMVLLGFTLLACSASKPARSSYRLPGPPPADPGAVVPPVGMIWVAPGVSRRGSDLPSAQPSERPAHRVEDGGFWIEVTEVTVARYARFQAESGYRSEAERERPKSLVAALAGLPGFAAVYAALPDPLPPGGLVPRALPEGGFALDYIAGASFRRPFGAAGPEARPDHPATHVSWRDAMAFCLHYGLRLPAESEWEMAARGGGWGTEHVWGEEPRLGATPLANLWTETSSGLDSGRDGFRGLAPVRSFPPNALGLHDVAGNVWEWTDEAHGADYAAFAGRGIAVRPRHPVVDAPDALAVLKGGSWLSPERAGGEDRPSARRAWPIGLGRADVGFRVVIDPALRWESPR